MGDEGRGTKREEIGRSAEGRPIFAYYSSTCGGHTADVEESWPARNIRHPYLRGVSDLRTPVEGARVTALVIVPTTD